MKSDIKNSRLRDALGAPTIVLSLIWLANENGDRYCALTFMQSQWQKSSTPLTVRLNCY